jgi:hypothetical protein
MKKIALTLAIVLGLGMASFADPNGGGMFQRGSESNNVAGQHKGNSGGLFAPPQLPQHGLSGNQAAPLGSGIALLTACGAAYLIAKKRKED